MRAASTHFGIGMDNTMVARPRWMKAGIVVGGWTVCALFFTPQIYLLNAARGRGYNWGQALSWNLTNFGIWAALTPLVLRVGNRFPFERRGWLRCGALHLVLSCAFSLLHIAINLLVTLLVEIVGNGERFTAAELWHWIVVSFGNMLIGVGATNVLLYWSALAVSQAISYFAKYQEREYRLAQAQLQSLRTQLHPHFFFNTLNAISELIHTDPEAADRTITGLSDLLRLALQNDQAHEVPLRVEVEFLRKYVSIQQMLLDERLSVEWQIDPAVLEAQVPTMILQPLVENAVRHGIAPRATPGHLRIAAVRIVSHDGKGSGDDLRLSVQDDGLGLPADWNEKVGSGIGLLNTRERLRHLYGDAQRFELEASPQGGVTVTITMPLRCASEKESAKP